MLLQRVVTAVVLLAILAASLMARSPLWFEFVMLVFLGGGFWEWFRLAGMPSTRAIALAVPLSAALWLFSYFAPQEAHWTALGLSVLVWLGYGIPSLKRGLPAPVQGRVAPGLALVGVVALSAAYVAVLMALQRRGGVFLLSLMAIVWVADIFAYFVGRTFGRHKLAPHISPGKTWEGAAGGLAAVLLYGLAWFFAPPAWAGQSYVGVLRDQYGAVVALLILAALTGFSICGDLFESMLKRRVGLKDSSHLLPGHGGVLDRIDALLPVLPLAVLVAR